MTVSQWPVCGTSRVLRRGDLLEVRLEVDGGGDGVAWLRTNLGGAAVRRREVIEHTERRRPLLARDWHDLPMVRRGAGNYRLRLPVLDVGAFEAKAFFVPEGGLPAWPAGGNLRVKVLPAHTLCDNGIYTAFPRQFGPALRGAAPPLGEAQAAALLDARGYAAIPPSGTFRDLIRHLDVIMVQMGFRIVQLLPVHPVPTTFARLGRYGSPFAACDFFGVDPGMAEFDRKATPMAQFEELLDAVHARGGYVFLDLPANHTGWASWLQLHHPEWFCRNPDGSYVNPGAWGVVWEDLCQLDFRHEELCRYMAEVFLHWCRKGVDGFRCDAGYMVPLAAWRYITAKVRDEFPDTVFLLEGLGGPPAVTEALLADGGLDWAYSELFQSLSAADIRSCLAVSTRLSREQGTLVHFAETHDNARLAATSTRFAQFRCALCALLSHDGAFGITNGVEWFAQAKVDVHGASPLNWGAHENQVDALRHLLGVLRDHPAFRAGAELEVVETLPADVVGFVRRPLVGSPVLVLANPHDQETREVTWPTAAWPVSHGHPRDLVSGRAVEVIHASGRARCRLGPQTVVCLEGGRGPGGEVALPAAAPRSVSGIPAAVLRQQFRVLALQLRALWHGLGDIAPAAAEKLGDELAQDPLGCLARLQPEPGYVPVLHWHLGRDERREVLVPPGHVLLVHAGAPFRFEVVDGERCLQRGRSLPWPASGEFGVVLPLPDRARPVRCELVLRVFGGAVSQVRSALLALPAGPMPRVRLWAEVGQLTATDVTALCADALGAMALVRGRWGEVQSQYEALLAANLHPDCPVDRRVLLTRCRVWVVYRDYSQEISFGCQTGFSTDLCNRVCWDFHAPVGMGRQIPLRIVLEMATVGNAIRLRFERHLAAGVAEALADDSPVALIVRPDVEDRSCHEITQAFLGPEHSFRQAVHPTADGFRFSPSPGHSLTCRMAPGQFVAEPEWLYLVPHPVEAARGLNPAGDLFSPGYFRSVLAGGEAAVLTAAAGSGEAVWPLSTGEGPTEVGLDEAARRALRRFVVRRGASRTVIAGYPWFLDWGRDTLICLRGIIAAGMTVEAREIIAQFARFESRGTLPNMIRGDDASDRETSDAPLWLFTAVADYLRVTGERQVLDVDCGGRPLHRVLGDLATAVLAGTPNGIRADPETGLVYSPAHFTWMDTNHPAGTPRQGYPIEIQALWYRALALLDELGVAGKPWGEIAVGVRTAVVALYAGPAVDGLSDCLHAGPGVSARQARADDACRPNQLLAVTLGLIEGEAARRSVEACWPLLVPGGIRSLADQPVVQPLAVRHRGQLLNDPTRPYWGRYEGDEDTRRKPAYHNGTAWSWLFPSFAEALVLAYGVTARPVARQLLYSLGPVLEAGCLGHVPEIVDGDAPHTQRGCVAQAWGVSELLRVLTMLRDETPEVAPVS
jgi:predicted glycogen debranching enzyme